MDTDDICSAVGTTKKKEGGVVIAENSDQSKFVIRVVALPEYTDDEKALVLTFQLCIRSVSDKLLRRVTVDEAVVQTALHNSEDVMAAAVKSQSAWVKANIPSLDDLICDAYQKRVLVPGPSIPKPTL